MAIDKVLLPVNKLKLWDHQKDAVKAVVEYFQRDAGKAFLVKMPTGTGKTGVFAALTRIALPNSNYIVITPSKSLKFQIIAELQSAFWDKISYDKSTLPSQVIIELMPSDIDQVLDKINGQKFIIVTTIQALQYLAANDNVKFEVLKILTDYLIFDEGHKEPAFTWGETVRSFKKHTVLFSATPYRNDYKIFNIDKENFYLLDHELCTGLNILRQLELKRLNVIPSTAAMFVTQLVSEFEKIKPSLISSGIVNPKVIIRCEKESEVTTIVNTLKKIKKSVIGIHQRFGNDSNTVKDVPILEDQNKFEYFVHQFKLVEGIDNPNFCVLAIYSDFSSSRPLIQQIGRVLRNPNKINGQKAILFTTNFDKINKEWSKYLSYDKTMSAKQKLFDITDVLSVNKEASTLYFSGTFRELVDVNNIDLTKAILYQKKVNCLQHDNSRSFEDLSSKILDEWSKRDYSILKSDVKDDSKLLILYIIYSNSSLVSEGVFIEQKLAITYFQYEKDVLFYYDSEQNHPWFEIDNVEPISREVLVNVFTGNKRLTKIHLHNTDIGNRSLRSKELHANSLEAAAPGLADHSFFLSRMEGYVDHQGNSQRRYLGLQYGKISDISVARINYEDYQGWINEIRRQLNIPLGSSALSRILNRFSQKVDPPVNTSPVSILLDLEDEVLSLYTYGDKKEEFDFDDLCANVSNGNFQLTINGTLYNFSINYELKLKRYLLVCAELDEMVECVEEKTPTIIGYLNANQSFRLILHGNNYIYAYKNFFKPGLNLLSKKKDLDLRQILNPIGCVTSTKSEKGNLSMQTDSTLWHKDSLFGMIARFGKGYNSNELELLFTFDYMVCDDLNDEIADFICLDTISSKIVMIHAKAGKSKLSASAFQEVCSQATKNLDFLIPFFSKEPELNLKKWGKKWSLSNVGTADRIIKGNCTPKVFWNKYKELISNPKTTREVWLFVGNLFDITKLQAELNKSSIERVAPEAVQLIYLLRSTWSSVSSVNASLKIFC